VLCCGVSKFVLCCGVSKVVLCCGVSKVDCKHKNYSTFKES